MLEVIINEYKEVQSCHEITLTNLFDVQHLKNQHHHLKVTELELHEGVGEAVLCKKDCISG